MLRRIVTALAVLCGAAWTAPAQNAAPPDLSGVWQINLPAFLKGGMVPTDQPAPARAAPRPTRAPNDPPYQPWAAIPVDVRGHIDKKQLASDGLYLGDSVGHWEDEHAGGGCDQLQRRDLAR